MKKCACVGDYCEYWQKLLSIGLVFRFRIVKFVFRATNTVAVSGRKLDTFACYVTDDALQLVLQPAGIQRCKYGLTLDQKMHKNNQNDTHFDSRC